MSRARISLETPTGYEALGPAKIVDTFLGRAIGLQFAFRPRTLIFENPSVRHVPLHMLFVFFPLDIAYLDSDMRVVETKARLMPFWFYFPRHPSKYVVEFRSGTLVRHGITVGSRLPFERV